MAKVFISYSTKDSDFAELAKHKLELEGFEVWLDQGALHPGEDWRAAIEEGIISSETIIVVLSPESTSSTFVTYEWAFALGRGVKIIPVLLAPSQVHPRLEAMQHLDFSNSRTRRWDTLFEEIKNAGSNIPPGEVGIQPTEKCEIAKHQILHYLDRKNLRMVSFDRIRKSIDPEFTDEFLMDVIRRNYTSLRRANLTGNRPGVGKVI